ncbi:hypothetical protein GCK72_006047 [Caenorhabditis remanei]|uniref:Uncharacterized protein n=1 Tax=Caenorhabditis remanei TaxID=31234 RepID=A0A6A5HGB5_CAERE|nr:hypothetical protein GCK72_006047 [Caenorhabditis remanei]KAF1766091.1 hypothetical protein GCK72_006047 [Caenorhabditis remanei]
MFANAKSSAPTIQVNQIESSSNKHPNLSKTYSTSQQKVPKFSKYSRSNHPLSWNPVDNPLGRHEKTFGPPSPERIKSEEEFPMKNKTTDVAHSTSLLPWLKKCDTDPGMSSLKPHKTIKFENPPGFEKTVDRFSSRLDRIGVLPSLSLQKHTDTTLGKVEKTLIVAALAQTKDKDCKKSLPLYDMLVERSDWLLLREDLNDGTESLPRDPFYSHDVVSSSGPENKLSVAENQILDDSPLDFLNETENLDSQEDFFNLNVLSCSENKSKVSRTDHHYPSSSHFCAFSTPDKRRERKRKSTTNSSSGSGSSSSTKKYIPESIKDTLSAPVITADFSPFDFSFLSKSNLSSPKKKQPPSKFSIW